MELVTGAGLAVSAGLNAYIPLLILGLSGHFLNFVTLPAAWAWLADPWILGILGVLLLVEIVADKIPAVDTVNDMIHTVIRPAAGGIAFGSGAGTTTTLVSDPAQFFSSGGWVPVAVGMLLAFATHATKATTRPVFNAASFGFAAPVVSTIEDVNSAALSVFAILAPIFAIILFAVGVTVFIVVFRKVRKRARERAAAGLKPRRRLFGRKSALAPPLVEEASA